MIDDAKRCRDAKRKEREAKNRFDVQFVVAEKWKGQDALATFLRMTHLASHGHTRAGLLGRPNTAMVRDIDRGKHAHLSC